MLASSWLLSETSRTLHCSFPGSEIEVKRGDQAIIVGCREIKSALLQIHGWCELIKCPECANGKNKRTLWGSKCVFLHTLFNVGAPESCLIFSSDLTLDSQSDWPENYKWKIENYVYTSVSVCVSVCKCIYKEIIMLPPFPNSEESDSKAMYSQGRALGMKVQRQFIWTKKKQGGRRTGIVYPEIIVILKNKVNQTYHIWGFFLYRKLFMLDY